MFFPISSGRHLDLGVSTTEVSWVLKSHPHCRGLSDDAHTPSRGKDGSSTCFASKPTSPCNSYSQHHPMPVPFSSQQQKGSVFYPRRKVIVVTVPAKHTMSLQFPRTMGASQMHKECKNPLASQILAGTNSAPSLSDLLESRQFKRRYVVRGAGASSSQAGPFLHVAAVAAPPLLLAPTQRPLADTGKQASSMNDQRLCEISNEPRRMLYMSFDTGRHSCRSNINLT
jgi:hypothetical protein